MFSLSRIKFFCVCFVVFCGFFQTQHEGRLYTLRIHCGEDYPDRCPSVRFVSKLNMGCVDQRSGEVYRNKLQVLAQWNRNYGIEQVRFFILPDGKLITVGRRGVSRIYIKLPPSPVCDGVNEIFGRKHVLRPSFDADSESDRILLKKNGLLGGVTRRFLFFYGPL